MAFSFSANIVNTSSSSSSFSSSSILNPHQRSLVHCISNLHFLNTSNNNNNIYTNTNLTTTGTKFFAISGKTSPESIHHQTSNTTTLTSWAEFAKNVSGEWDGFGADFSKEGKPIELPESVVPEAYREWEVKVFDWQTQCPTLACPKQPALAYKLIRLLPTVGCEADAATKYNIDERIIDLPSIESNKVSAFSYQSSGCYVAIWPVEDHGTHNGVMEVEHCLIDPRDRESRVRIVQIVHLENHKLELQSIRVFSEQWYGPFRNGDQLGGCAIRDSAFASTQALHSSQVIGAWQGLNAVASFRNPQTNIIQELAGDRVQKLVRDEENIILLPKQLWCSFRALEDGYTCCEAGWLLYQDRAITSRCIFSSNAELKEIRVASEIRESYVAAED